MLTNSHHKHPWLRFPPRLVIGAFLVLAPIFILLTVQALNRQRDNVTNLMVEKGAALIRSFEAGARTGMMMGPGGSGFRVQRLLTETAKQPDIVFLSVTDKHGQVLAHSDLAKVGSGYGRDLDLEKVAGAKEVQWRTVSADNGGKVFEVYRSFHPLQRFRREHPGRHLGRVLSQPGLAPDNEQIIFVGLEMTSVESARRQDARHTVVMGVILLLVCFAGLLIVFLLQAYDSTKSSLARLTIFSQRLTENMPIGLLALAESGRVLALNGHGAALLGLAEDLVVGQLAGECLPPTLAQLVEQPQDLATVVSTELACLLADGRSLPLEVMAAPLADAGGRFSEKVFLFRDLSEVKALKLEILRSQRLAAIGRLAAGVAHEIRNPLSSIKGFATYFRERYQEVEEDQEIATIMIQEVERLNRVVGQLLEFASPLAIKRTQVWLPELLAHSLRMIAEDAQQKGVQVRQKIGQGVEQVWLDGDRLTQVLLNLYLNGIEAMDNGGHLDIFMTVADKMLEVRIADNGRGIMTEAMGSIFDPYFTTKPAGTGLGLAIVHKIVEAMGGEISVQSKVGKGTEFTLLVPVDKEDG